MSKDTEEKKNTRVLQEEAVLKEWQERDIFKKTLEKDAPKGEFVFYDGPPFATGLPHYGSLLGSIVKDVIPRYKTMRGYFVRRRWGWDCHGLPIENMIEKKLGLKSKKDIEEMGIAQFNEACRDSVLQYVHDWKWYIDRVGRWVDFDNSYKTMDVTYTESVWWALKEMYGKGLIYEGNKVLLYCPHCETPLAKAEIAMDNSYKDVTEEAVYIKFKITHTKSQANSKLHIPNDKPTYLLAWTTTPWTLPGNVALAVSAESAYVLIRSKDEYYILGKERVESVLKDHDYEVVEEIVGKDLIGLEYEPLYDIPAVKATGKKAHYVSEADFVTTTDGTGLVHTAVMYGEDDYELGKRIDLPMVALLDAKAHFNNEAPEFIRGKYFKQAEKDVKADLEKRDLLFARENNTHSYPHCHRCGTALLYNALSSWFVNIAKVKERMITLNEKIAWHPDHLKEGRFGKTLAGAPDWTLSRNRYWASPLPIWKCNTCNALEFVGSIDELKDKQKKTGTRFLIMRHGEAENNTQRIMSVRKDNPHHLTAVGKKQVAEAAEALKKEKVDVLIVSPFVRTRETAEIIAETIGFSKESIIFDERIGEVRAGDFDGKSIDEFHAYFTSGEERFTKNSPNGENYAELKGRMGDFLYEAHKKYEGKTVLVISHESPLWLLRAVAEGYTADEALNKFKIPVSNNAIHINNGEVHELPFVPLPHNKKYELDLHRPYIDEVVLACSCGGEMKRIPEVLDGWFESGSMPFAEYHYPFENKEVFEKRRPADFIAEYIAQTRTWFYYMHAVSTILFDDIGFKNVATTGNMLAEDGSKMSKSKGNFTDPKINLNRYGADALRLHLMGGVVMQAEDMNFADSDLKEAQNRTINILWNTFLFYQTYGSTDAPEEEAESDHVLDVWVRTLLARLHTEVSASLDAYNTVQAVRAIKEFITEFSTWYIRRSRDRFKSDDTHVRAQASSTTRFVFFELSKIIAPIMPFIAEDIYKGVGGSKESVHLEEWTESMDAGDSEALTAMDEVRRIVSLALECRARANIKVRQPLQAVLLSFMLPFPDTSKGQLLELIQEEINVKEIIENQEIPSEVELDINITPELREEGEVRELIRALQEARKSAGSDPNEHVRMHVGTDATGRAFIEKHQEELVRGALVSEFVFKDVSTDGISVGEMTFAFSVENGDC